VPASAACLRLQPCTSGFSSGSEGGEKRRKFEQMRKQHYNMRDALVQVCAVCAHRQAVSAAVCAAAT
jgi:hypothetical protein